MSLRNKKHLGDDLGDHLDKMIDSLLEEHKPPYEELKDSPEVLSLLPIARLLKTLRPSPPENFKVKSTRPWLVPALSTLTCLLLAFILIAFFFPGTIPLFARNESNLYYLGPSVYRMRLEVKLDGKIVERELAQVWYISSDTFRIQVKNLLQGQVDELIANGNDAWQYFPDENRWIQVGLFNLPPERSRFLPLRPISYDAMHTSSYDQYSGTGLIEENEEKEEQSGWPRQRIYREANLEATMTLENFEKVKVEQIGPFPKPSGVAYPATLDSLFAHLEKDQLQEGENLNLNGYSNRDRYLLVQIRSSADLSLKEEAYFIKEGDFSISLRLPKLTPGEYSLTYYDLVPFAGMKEGGKLPFKILP